MLVQFMFAIPRDKNDKNYENIVIKTSTNVCKLAQGVMGDFVVKMIMTDFHKFADFDIGCPFKKVRELLENYNK